jgi:hypothetical protein
MILGNKLTGISLGLDRLGASLPRKGPRSRRSWPWGSHDGRPHGERSRKRFALD